MIPGIHYYPRGTYEIKKICEYAAEKEFTGAASPRAPAPCARGLETHHGGVLMRVCMRAPGIIGGHARGKNSCPRHVADILVTEESHKKLRGLWLVHLPNGPTAHFKLSSVKLSKDIRVRASQPLTSSPPPRAPARAQMPRGPPTASAPAPAPRNRVPSLSPLSRPRPPPSLSHRQTRSRPHKLLASLPSPSCRSPRVAHRATATPRSIGPSSS